MSSSATPNLALGYIVASQAQKEVTHNGALNDLDFLAKLSVIDYTLGTPPSSPATGDTYIIGSSPTGAWAGSAHAVAGYYSGWSIKPPQAGWVAWTQNGNRLLYYTGSAWALLAVPCLDGTLSWDPGAITSGAGLTSSSVTVTGAALGDLAIVAAPYDLQGISATAYVSASDTAKIQLANLTGSSVTLGSGTWRVRVVKA
ncbi:MAG TPA: DUF2793 domain-containing protein [Alphaproteobacteria bacterium]|nr:DUF2793 domain-containing protein [Alphaproteobacteria bacterium]